MIISCNKTKCMDAHILVMLKEQTVLGLKFAQQMKVLTVHTVNSHIPIDHGHAILTTVLFKS